MRQRNSIHYSLPFGRYKQFAFAFLQHRLPAQLWQASPACARYRCAGLGIDCTMMADVLKRLEKRGLITRKPSGQDRRQCIARLSGNERTCVKCLESHRARYLSVEMTYRSCLASEDRAVFTGSDWLISFRVRNVASG
ncbi:MarR family transcriptional regulator [Mycetohabitans sp. B8]|uniref:MarR family transcriptional regulator n=1 Tax=Mycetohabitans sp. B8 TaxID=2841845 RepID=UPI0034CFF074|nr:MarR family transcriptional regulator [Mycetohabitans sp. B8]